MREYVSALKDELSRLENLLEGGTFITIDGKFVIDGAKGSLSYNSASEKYVVQLLTHLEEATTLNNILKGEF